MRKNFVFFAYYGPRIQLFQTEKPSRMKSLMYYMYFHTLFYQVLNIIRIGLQKFCLFKPSPQHLCTLLSFIVNSCI